jgi:hypothetical protein
LALNSPEQSLGEDTDVLNNLLSNLKTGRVQRQSMKRVLPKDPTLQLAPIELLKIEIYRN